MILQLSRIDGNSILIIGFLLMACGSTGLVAVRVSNPRLKGIDWLGVSFAAGGTGTLLLFLSSHIPPFFGIVLSDLLVTLAYVLFHVAILAMHKKGSLWPKVGLCLLALQLSGYLWMTFVHPAPSARVALLGFIISAQLAQTILLLLRKVQRGHIIPSGFTAAVLFLFLLANLYRSTFLLFFLPRQRASTIDALQSVMFMVFIASALGIAFGFFWMTTAELTGELEAMASVDPLTRIYNRRVFREWCEREFIRSVRVQNSFSVLMMDLDHFKEINDRYGHKGGDDVLVAVVESIQNSIRGIDVVGRWGGEEFIALLPDTTPETALIVAQRVRTNIEKLLIKTSVGITRLTISIGIATFRGPQDNLDDILLRADKALYLVKKNGRNQVLIAS